jgi:hypothetical protein
MTKAPLLLFLAGAAGAFCLGVWLGPGLRARFAGAPTTDPPSTHSAQAPPPLASGTPAGSIVLDPAQAKTDARLALESPQAFLDSLRGDSGLKAQARIAAAIAEMPLHSVRELAGLVDRRGFENVPRGWQFAWTVFERWGELDPEDLLEAARQSPHGLLGYTGTQSAFSHLARRDPTGAWARAQDAGSLGFYAKISVIQAIGESDPAQALQLTQQDPHSRQNSWSLTGVMQSWFMRDRDAALSALESIPTGDLRKTLVAELGATFAATDPEAALAWGRGLASPVERQSAMATILDFMATRDPLGTLKRLDQPEFAQLRRQGLASVVSTWSRRDFGAALDYVLGSQSPGDRQEMLGVLGRSATLIERQRLLEVAQSLPPSASKAIYESTLFGGGFGIKQLDVIDNVKSPGVREELIKSALDNWWGTPVDSQQALFAKLQPSSQTTQHASQLAHRLAQSDPAAALRWSEGLGSADLQKAARRSAIQAWAESDPRAAAQRAATVSDPAERSDVLRSIASQWARSDDQSALAWARSLSGPDQVAALGAMVQNSLQASPHQAQELYSSFASSLDAETAKKSENTAIARSMAATLTENDPHQAISWAQGLSPGSARDQALAGIAEKWSSYDPAATSEWLGTLPAGEGRDLAAEKLVHAIARDDPESAWAWATSIGTPAQRREAAARVLDAWKGYGKTAEARAALDAAGFDPDVIRELARRLD